MKKLHLSFESENLAVPEVHTGAPMTPDDTEKRPEDSVVYADVAIPEVHFKKKPPKEEKE